MRNVMIGESQATKRHSNDKSHFRIAVMALYLWKRMNAVSIIGNGKKRYGDGFVERIR